MDKQPVSFKLFFLTIGFSSLILLFLLTKDLLNKNSKIIFCDVGQGDAAYIRTKEKIDILIDAGPDRKVLTCLGKYMPFYDRTIELAFLSHPQKDHYGGFLSILDRYKIDNFILAPLNNEGKSFSQFLEKLVNKKIKIKTLYSESVINLNNKKTYLGTKITIIWPDRETIANNIKNTSDTSSNILDLKTVKGDLNNFSQILLFSEKKFNLLFDSDSSFKVLENIAALLPNKIDILKVPHHGSKNGLSYKFLKLANPALSVISVGRNNSYGHPSKEVLEIFKALDKKYLRTDEKGDIAIELNDNGWRVR